ncbi:MAG: cellulase family glycosylhydrolase, partial [Oscillospiraceae bacterium]|nr:cellulase family glycosylhydrolase [Oscillospiraceae bacterium]
MKRLFSVVIVIVIALSLVSCGSTESSAASARVYVEGTSFMVNGSELWINGVNTPWISWNDFTGNMDEEAWEETFALLASDNINCTRIWINCDGESIVSLTEDGEIIEINSGHWDDLDKLFALAEKYEVYVMATLLSFDHFKGSSGDDWQAMVNNKDTADAFAETYVKEFCERYGDCEYLFSIDIMNEPDWVYENEECGNVEWENLSYFFGKCASVIHENSDILVTVGLG